MFLRDLERAAPYIAVGAQWKDLVAGRTRTCLAAGRAAREAIATPEALRARQAAMRAAFLSANGGLPETDAPLAPQVTGTLDCGTYRLEKVVLQARPKAYVTCDLYVPHALDGPAPALLFLCGHSDKGKHSPVYHVIARMYAEAGFVVLAQDPVGQGERLSYYDPALEKPTVGIGTGEHTYAGQQCLPLGHGIARYFLHDSMRCIDYLCTRPEVDPARIAVTGHSGGGTQTAMLMLAEPRIAAAAPGTFLSSREAILTIGNGQDMEQIWPGTTAQGLDHADFLVCMAPRPVMVLAATHDFFPIEGTREAVAQCHPLWAMTGQEDRLALYEEDTGHTYSRGMAKAAADFLSLHLRGKPLDAAQLERMDAVQPMPEKLLYVTNSGQVRGDWPDARFVHAENQDALNAIDPAGYQKDAARAWLSEQVLRDRRPCDPLPRRVEGQIVFEDLVCQPWFWSAQEGLTGFGCLFRAAAQAEGRPPVTLALWDGGTDAIGQHYAFLKDTCAQGLAVLVLDTTGAGKLRPFPTVPAAPDAWQDPKLLSATLYAQACNLLWLGDSLAAMRTYDVLRAIDMLAATGVVQADGLALYCAQAQGVYGLLAALIDPRVRTVTDATTFEGYRAFVQSRYYDDAHILGLLLPGVLRHLDLPQLRGWIKAR